MLRRLQAGRRQPLARACGLHKTHGLSVLDCTAGLAQDSLTLAALGSPVQPLERHPVVHRMLLEAFSAPPATDRLNIALAHCRSPLLADAGAYLNRLTGDEWDVIYLDPMFSGYTRKALPKKSMQIFALLCGEDHDASNLLASALGKAVRRVVVKRGPQAPFLAGRTPDHQVTGNRTRFDIYFTASRA